MNFFDFSLPIGRFAGVTVRLHFTLLITAVLILQQGKTLAEGITNIFVLYLSILLHEFGHVFAARFCDGVADEIMLWPLGGLAFCRPLFNRTAHLMTTIGGPLVTLVLALISGFFYFKDVLPHSKWVVLYVGPAIETAFKINAGLLIFNMIPAFPMDGGRIVRDLLWYWIGVDRATRFAVGLTRVIAIIGLIFAAISLNFIGIALTLFVFMGAEGELRALEWEGREQPFSLKERIRRFFRQRKFQSSVAQKNIQEAVESFHQCAICKRTEHSPGDVHFRVASDGNEYCIEHLPMKGS